MSEVTGWVRKKGEALAQQLAPLQGRWARVGRGDRRGDGCQVTDGLTGRQGASAGSREGWLGQWESSWLNRAEEGRGASASAAPPGPQGADRSGR